MPKIKVRAQTHMEVRFLHRAGISFPVNEWKELEVLDQDDSPPPVTVMVTNSTTGLPQAQKRPNQDVIGRKTYEVLKKDNRLTIHELGSLQADAANEQLKVARAEVTRLAGELTDAKGNLAVTERSLLDEKSAHEATQMKLLEHEDRAERTANDHVAAIAGKNSEIAGLKDRIAELEKSLAASASGTTTAAGGGKKAGKDERAGDAAK